MKVKGYSGIDERLVQTIKDEYFIVTSGLYGEKTVFLRGIMAKNHIRFLHRKRMGNTINGN